MKQERKIYDPALSELARELGIKVSLLYKWRKDYQEYGKGSFPGKGNLKMTPEQERIHELEKKLKDAEMERDILKKAISIFSKSGR
ncbi:MAG: transposase [Flavobacterium sp.]|nr:transposase [Flavobacterium sp.]